MQISTHDDRGRIATVKEDEELTVTDQLDALDEILGRANMVPDEDDIYERRYNK